MHSATYLPEKTLIEGAETSIRCQCVLSCTNCSSTFLSYYKFELATVFYYGSIEYYKYSITCTMIQNSAVVELNFSETAQVDDR